jgi:hypothetical protein
MNTPELRLRYSLIYGGITVEDEENFYLLISENGLYKAYHCNDTSPIHDTDKETRLIVEPEPDIV